MNININDIICAFTILISLYAFSNEEVKVKLMHIPYREHKFNEKYRLLTAGFIHSDTMHLLFNMIALFSFGRNVLYWFQSPEMFGRMGGSIYIFFYTVSIIAASLPTHFKHKNNSYYAALGASGAISAVIFASIINNPWMMILMPFPMPGFLFGVLYIWYESRASKNFNDNIGHDAHLYGAIFGVLFVTVVNPYSLLDCVEQIKIGIQNLMN